MISNKFTLIGYVRTMREVRATKSPFTAILIADAYMPKADPIEVLAGERLDLSNIKVGSLVAVEGFLKNKLNGTYSNITANIGSIQLLVQGNGAAAQQSKPVSPDDLAVTDDDLPF